MLDPRRSGGRHVIQRARVERELRRAGSRGLTQVDFDPPTIDGGPPIRRLASRIAELRSVCGLRIDSSGRRHKMAVYRMVAAPEDEQRSTPACGGAQERLERLVVEPRPLSPYDREVA